MLNTVKFRTKLEELTEEFTFKILEYGKGTIISGKSRNMRQYVDYAERGHAHVVHIVESDVLRYTCNTLRLRQVYHFKLPHTHILQLCIIHTCELNLFNIQLSMTFNE